MQYDVKLRLHYDYDAPVAGGRHLVRVMPQTRGGQQRVIAAALSFSPEPSERSEFTDFFGNQVTAIAYRAPHETLDVRMTARVDVAREDDELDVSPSLPALREELLGMRSVAPESPFHFLGESRWAPRDAAITAYARESAAEASVFAVADALMRRIARDFEYDPEATDVGTPATDAFELRRGVCQDFTHIMLSGLRGLGIPAAYVSGYLRTIPPPGKERLEGADAMHAWVSVWCGREAGWREFDPTNAMRAGNDHIAAGQGRDYGDVSPILGVVKLHGGQAALQEVDVTPVGG